jgi:hypothetical protein
MQPAIVHLLLSLLFILYYYYFFFFSIGLLERARVSGLCMKEVGFRHQQFAKRFRCEDKKPQL